MEAEYSHGNGCWVDRWPWEIQGSAQQVPEEGLMILVTNLFQNFTHKRPLRQFSVFEMCTNSPSNISMLISVGVDMTGQQATKGFPGFGDKLLGKVARLRLGFCCPMARDRGSQSPADRWRHCLCLRQPWRSAQSSRVSSPLPAHPPAAWQEAACP